MHRRFLVLAAVSIVFMGIGIAIFRLVSQPPKPPLINAAPSIALESIPLIHLTGREQQLGDWKQPILIVNFWAPWCAPCRDEIPVLVEFQKQYTDQVQVLGLAIDSVENIQSFSVEYAMNYPSFIASEHISLYNAVFENTTGGIPFTAFIDHQRQLYATHTGQMNFEQLREVVSQLLPE